MEGNITSEQILHQSFNERQKKLDKPSHSIQDLQELHSLQLSTRKDYEQQINKNRLNFGQWLRYAKWEIDFNHDIKRSESIYERALQVNPQHIPFWVNYIKTELAHNNINHGRNVLDRAITMLPRVDKLWYLYLQTEETLKNYNKVRFLFETWLQWYPPSSAYDAYIKFEFRYDEIDNVRRVFQKYVMQYPQGNTWMKWVDFELSLPKQSQNIGIIRNVFELSVDTLVKTHINDDNIPELINKWAIWEFKNQEIERSQAIFATILDKSKFNFTSSQYQNLLHYFTYFDINMGDKESTLSTILLKRKLKYSTNVEQDRLDFDSWWLLLDITMEDKSLSFEEIRTLFDRAVEAVPPHETKTLLWKRWIFLWIRYAFWEEFTNDDIARAKGVWNKCLKVIPHNKFTFNKAWIMAAQFELRNGGENRLSNTRKILGKAIGTMNYPKNNLFRFYIDLENKLGEWDRIRKIYEKWLEVSIIKSDTSALAVLLDYIEFEKGLEETSRCEALYEMGLLLIHNDLTCTKLTPFEVLWTSFIDYYRQEFEYDKARDIYQRLLTENDHVKVWISYAMFESSIPNEEQLLAFQENDDITELEFELEHTQKNRTRRVFKLANDHFKEIKGNEERLIILEAWKDYERINGEEEDIKRIEDKLPSIVKKTVLEHGINQQYLEYVFPEDKNEGIGKFLENARKWKEQLRT